MRLLETTVLALFITLVLGDKWSYLKENEKKRMEKKKEYRTVEEAKKEAYEKPMNKINYKKGNTKKFDMKMDETFLKDEQFQLCRSVEEDDVKNTLLKFGLVTHLYDEVSKFRKAMKSLQDLTPKSKKKKKAGPASIAKADKEIIKQKGGPVVKLSQSNWVGRSLAIMPPLTAYHYGYDDGTNFVEGKKRRRKRDSYLRTTRGRKGTLKVPVGQVPLCYGWKYLKALDALIDDENVDTEYLDQSVSDMLDMKFSQAVSTIIEDCGNALLGTNRDVCPSPEVQEQDEETCDDQCQPGGETDCQFREICCKASCGGYRCLPIKTAKSNKCEEADQFMQCLYMKIDTQLCSGE